RAGRRRCRSGKRAAAAGAARHAWLRRLRYPGETLHRRRVTAHGRRVVGRNTRHHAAAAVVILAGAGWAFCAGAGTSVPRALTVETRPALLKRGDANVALTKSLHL